MGYRKISICIVQYYIFKLNDHLTWQAKCSHIANRC